MQSEPEVFWETLSRSLTDGTFRRLRLVHPLRRQDDVPQRQSVRPILLRGDSVCQWELQFGKRQHHLNLGPADSLVRVRKLLGVDYREARLETDRVELHADWRDGLLTVKSSAKGRIDPALPLEHDREKRYLIPEGVPCPFLCALDVMTADGKVKAKKERKFRQINRYLEIVNDVVSSLPATGTIRVVDFGCGLSYLTFAVRHLLSVIHGRDVDLIGIDRDPHVIERCRSVAAGLDLRGVTFVPAAIDAVRDDVPIDLAISLHACDTATDAALEFAVARRAAVILAAPCCQHELAQAIRAPRLEVILRHGILRERFAALATDALRAAALEGAGYKTQVLEFIDLEHTPKNLLIRAVKKEGTAADAAGRARYADLKTELGLTEIAVDRIVRAAEKSSTE